MLCCSTLRRKARACLTRVVDVLARRAYGAFIAGRSRANDEENVHGQRFDVERRTLLFGTTAAGHH